MDKERAYTTPE